MSALTREKKAQLIDELTDKLQKAKMVILTNYKGLSVADLEELRRQTDKHQVEYKIVKNTLVKLALKKAGLKIDESLFEGPLAMAFSFSDEIISCRILYNFSKNHEALEIRSGIVNGNLVDVDYIKKLALLPTHEELEVRLVGSLSSPLVRLHNVLFGNVRSLIYLLNSFKENK